MNEENRDERIRFRLTQATEVLREAKQLLDASLYRGAINRAYYAMFYSLLGLTVLKGISLSKHSGVIAFFDREFIKTKILPRELSKVLHVGFDRRQTSDYGEVWCVDQTEAELAYTEAVNFVNSVENYIQSSSRVS
jgi:uncharacterized protein (UPF0332 family)